MIYEGTDLKFRIIPKNEILNMDDMWFTISVKNRWGQVVYETDKDDCFRDSDGNYYFTMENVRNGVLNAIFTTGVYDEDYVKLERVFTDIRHLTSVGVCDCQTDDDECECVENHIVAYEQVWTMNIDEGEYLVGSDGSFIITSDGMRIKFKKPNP